LDTRFEKILFFVILGAVLVGTALMANYQYGRTWDDVEVPTHSIRAHSLGLHQQSDPVRARVAIDDEDTVDVMEGRVAIIQLLDSDNKASMEQGKGYIPLTEFKIDVKETSFLLFTENEGEIEYTAHRTDTYYLVYRNEDWRNLKLKVANGDDMDDQLIIKVYVSALVPATILIFAWAYGKRFGVSVLQKMGLVGRPKGPGSKAAQEPKAPQVSAADMVLEAEGDEEGEGPPT
jgi:hypothetical protein